MKDASGADSAGVVPAEAERIPDIPFEKALSRVFASEDLGPDHTFRGRRAVKSVALKTMPKYLLVQVQRYYVDPQTWSHKKRECTCRVPDVLDLEKYRAPPRGENGAGPRVRAGEVAMPDEDERPGGGGAASAGGVQPDMELVNQLLVMGFSENGCKRACVAVGNSGVEAASEWIFAHMEDADFNDPLPAAAGGAPPAFDPEMIGMLQAITGFEVKYCQIALKNNSNNADLAAAWLFERTPPQIDEEEAAKSASGGGAADVENFSDGPGRYSLAGFISHVGKATSSGHYVAHIKKNGVWCLFDDEKVAKSEKTPFEYGYVYCFKRDD